MAVTPMGRLPFQYATRWMYIEDLSVPMRQRLEERDRQLEDFLGGFGSGQASAMRRTTLQTFNVADIAIINFTTTDYMNGAHAGTFGGGGCIIIDKAAKWNMSLWAAFGPTAGNDPLQLQLAVYRGGNVEGITSNPTQVDDTVYFEGLTMDAALQVGDIVYGAVFVTGGGTCVGSVYGNLTPARLACHTVG